MNIPLKHPTCNGWAIVDKNQICCSTPRNYHVAEVRIDTDISGKKHVYLNSSNETCCKLPVKSQWSYYGLFYANQANQLRTELANMQNCGKETCGNCVGHFYADPEV